MIVVDHVPVISTISKKDGKHDWLFGRTLSSRARASLVQEGSCARANYAWHAKRRKKKKKVR